MDFEQGELLEPRKALDEAGSHSQVFRQLKAQLEDGTISDWGEEYRRFRSRSTKAEISTLLLLPGGVMNPDRLRSQPQAVSFVRHFVDGQAHSGHLPWTVDADRGRRRCRGMS